MARRLLLILALILSMRVLGTSLDTQLLRISTTLPLGNPTVDSLLFYSEKIDSIPHLKAKVYPASELGGNEDAMLALQFGIVDIALISSSVIAQKVPLLSLLSLPYTFQDQAHSQRVLSCARFNRIVQKDLEEAGYKLLFWAIGGERSVMNNIRPIYRLSDMNGLRIRTQKAPISIQLFKSIGAKPQPLNQAVVYSYLESKAIDGWENSPTTLYTLNLYPVTRYVSYTRHFVIPDLVLMSKEIYDQLSKQQRLLLERISQQAQSYQWKIWQESEERMRLKLIEKGVLFNEVEHINEFIEASEYLKDEYRTRYGHALLDLVEELRDGTHG